MVEGLLREAVAKREAERLGMVREERLTRMALLSIRRSTRISEQQLQAHEASAAPVPMDLDFDVEIPAGLAPMDVETAYVSDIGT